VPTYSDKAGLIAIAASVATIDQLTKLLLVSTIGRSRLEPRIEVVDGWLALEYTENRGAAFGLLSGLVPILTVVSIAILSGLLLHFMRQVRPPLWQTVAIGAIAGGAFGNLLDRFRLGYVIDFVSVGPWPNFNIADSAITIGVMVLIWGSTRPAAASAMPQRFTTDADGRPFG
jgi:signal peptidase II